MPAVAPATTVLLFLLALSLFARTTFAGTLDGTVKNGTNGKLATGADVILIQLQGGMQPVANTKTDAQGHFTSIIRNSAPAPCSSA